MPRPKKPGAPEPKRRSRTGCWPCKARKIKCGEEKPTCINCQRQNEKCDYSIRLNWEGRGRKRSCAFEIESPAPQQNAVHGVSPLSSAAASAQAVTVSTQPYRGLIEFAAPVLPSPNTEVSTSNLAVKSQPAPQFFQSTLNFNNAPASAHFQGSGLQSMEHTGVTSLPAPSPGSAHMTPGCSNDSTLLSSVTAAEPQRQRIDSYARKAATDSPQPSPSLISPGSYAGASFLAGNPPTISSYSTQAAAHDSSEVVKFDSPVLEDNGLPSEHASKRVRLATLVEAAINDNEGIIHSLPGANQHKPRQLSHRVSVNSLLSQSLSTGSGAVSSPDHSSPYCISDTEILRDEFINYGYDHGHADLDLYNGTTDLTAMMLAPSSQDGSTSGSIRTGTDIKSVFQSNYNERASSPDSDEEAQSRPVTVFSKGGYYASPVPVNIPKFLMPLPSSLTQSPINLLYFHHFLNHTGKILAPHACNHNPFTTVLPRMAITNQNLLNLLLAYSASHRSRLIGHPEPSHRIAHWVRFVFPSLRHALSDPHQRSSPTTLATAIMLVSLKIISPSTFEVPISWQDHLKLARELYVFYRKAHYGRPPTQVGHFLSNWFGYIDILGSISCEEIAPPVPGVYYPPDMTLSPLHDDEDWEIECYSGFTPRTGAAMFRLAALISQSKNDRLKASPDREAKSDSDPRTHTLCQAEQLLRDMMDDRLNIHKRHTSHDNEDLDASASVPRAIDDAYQLACIIQLYRRVLGKSQLDPSVRKAIDELMMTLDTVERGGSAEVCLLFPIFTVGCETTDLMHRQTIIDRVKSFEHLGLKQIREARKLMQRAWEANCSWTMLANGEFLG